MTRKFFIVISLLAVMLMLAACGTAAEPSYEVAEMQAQEVDTHSEDVVEPTNTPEPPTATPIPPTNTPEPPTATPIPPTNTPEPPTEAPTEVAIGADDPLFEAVNAADAANGQTLFASNGCIGCHTTDSSGAAQVGPGQWNVLLRAGDRVEGQGPYTYIFNSIIHPSDYVVENFPDGMMPQTFRDMFTDEQIYDIIAYLATLHD